jgi:hypothetical protein
MIGTPALHISGVPALSGCRLKSSQRSQPRFDKKSEFIVQAKARETKWIAGLCPREYRHSGS